MDNHPVIPAEACCEPHHMRGKIECAHRWNKIFRVGTRVTYFPVSGSKEQHVTRTRSEAWELGSGHVVVMLDGFTGGKAISHLVPDETGK